MKVILLVLLLGLPFCFAQLPFQVKPTPRGFPGKRGKDGSNRKTGRGGLEAIGMFRLNNTFRPSHYDLEIRVILDDDGFAGPEFTVPGKVKISGVNKKQTNKITMHANELQINTSSITISKTSDPPRYVKVTNTSEESLTNFFTLHLDSEIYPDEEYEIYMEYVANITDAEEGLFYRTIATEGNEEFRIAVTQLESVEARRLFPCFDEPDLKATFELTVIRKNEYATLSNTELIASTPDLEYEGWTSDKFARTVRMSTYNLALAVINNFAYAESFFGKKAARTYAPRHMIEARAGDYSAEAAARCLNFYESFFNESYKLSKMDSIAIPDFGGAMENWGLNVYEYDNLLHFPNKNSEARRNSVTTVVAHELAHQWFGNLVTMKWWSDLYLVEGLSSYVQYLGADAANADLKATEFIILDSVQYSMLYDASSRTHPLYNWNISTPFEIDEMFSIITYEKGASIFRMVEGFLTQETLRKGLQLYLKKLAFGSAEQEDLFVCLADAASQDNRLPKELSMSQIMHSWTDKSGFPLVTVKVVDENTISLRQQPFRNKGNSSVRPDAGEHWYIPVTTTTKEKPYRDTSIPDVWLEANNQEKLINHNSSHWIMINHNGTGYFRVLYDQPILQLIQEQLGHNAHTISPLSRSQLLDDYFVFAKQEYVNIQTTLNLTRYLHQENHFAPWGTFFEHFEVIYNRFSSHAAFPLIQKFLQPKVDAALLAIGLEESSSHRGMNAMFRANLLDWSCSLHSPLCQEYAGKLFKQLTSNSSVNPIMSIDAKLTLECAIVATRGRQAYDFFFRRYEAAKHDRDLREDILSTLACSMDSSVIQDLLGKTVNATSNLHPSDAITVLEKLTTNPKGRSVILEFISKNIDYIVNEVGIGRARAVGSVFVRLSKYYCTQQQLDTVEHFIRANEGKLSAINSTINGTRKRINENIAWMNSTGNAILNWLHSQK